MDRRTRSASVLRWRSPAPGGFEIALRPVTSSSPPRSPTGGWEYLLPEPVGNGAVRGHRRADRAGDAAGGRAPVGGGPPLHGGAPVPDRQAGCAGCAGRSAARPVPAHAASYASRASLFVVFTT